MSFSIAIVGLPNVGKSTLFKTLTKKPVDIAPYPFTTLSPNIGVVVVPDERLEKIAKVIKPEKITPTIIEFVDIAGLVKDSHQGEGLGNQFLAQIRNCDAILEVIRAFESRETENVLGEINPKKEIEVLQTELIMKDLETLEKLRPKLEKEAKNDKKLLKKFELLEKIKENLFQGKLISQIDLTEEEKAEIKEYQFLTQKPIFYLLNADGKTKYTPPDIDCLTADLKYEEEISEFSPAEREELGIESQSDSLYKFGSGIDQLILACYNILDLITFFTVAGGKETRAWTLKRGSKVLDAGGMVHSDFKEKFIRAEVIPWEKLITAGSWKAAREKGWLQIVGKDYIVRDGEVIEFKI